VSADTPGRVGGSRYRLPMTSEATRAIIAHLSTRIDEQSAMPLKKIDLRDGDSGWIEPFLTRAAAAIADVADIEYATGVVSVSDDRSTVSGTVVVITHTVVISGTFQTDRDRLFPEGRVKAWPRAAIERVSVDEIRSAEYEGDPKRPDDAAVVTLVLSGNARIHMPPAAAEHELPVWDSRFLAFLPNLLR
jgi:hypothetical protein